MRCLSQGLAQRLENTVLADVVLEADDQEFQSHRIVLASSSEYFERMFEGCFCESQASRIKLPGKSGDAVGAVLRLIYLASSVPSVLREAPWTVLEVYDLAREWMLPDVAHEVLRFVREELSDVSLIEEICDVLAAGSLGMPEMKEACSMRARRLRARNLNAKSECKAITTSAAASQPQLLMDQRANTSRSCGQQIQRQVIRRQVNEDGGYQAVRCPRRFGSE
jgi:hypothetical protein